MDRGQRQACIDALGIYKSTMDSNVAIAQFNSDQSAKAGQAYSEWDKEYQQHLKKFNYWKNRTGEYARFAQQEAELRAHRKPTGEGIQPQAQWCMNDHGANYDAESRSANGAGVGRMICKYTEQFIRGQVEPGHQAVMPRFDKPAPVDRTGQFAHKTQVDNDVDIQCCSNVVNVSGNASDVYLSCRQALMQDDGTEDVVTTETSLGASPSYTVIVAIVVIVLLLCSSSSLLVGLSL